MLECWWVIKGIFIVFLLFDKRILWLLVEMIFFLCLVIIEIFEFRVVWCFNLVLIMYFLDWESGIVWCCILEFIKVWFVLLCLIKGMREFLIEKYWKGKIFLIWICFYVIVRNFWWYLVGIICFFWIFWFKDKEFFVVII